MNPADTKSVDQSDPSDPSDTSDPLPDIDCPNAVGLDLHMPAESSPTPDTAVEDLIVPAKYLWDEPVLAAGDYVNKDGKAPQGCLIDGMMKLQKDGMINDMLKYQAERMVGCQNDGMVKCPTDGMVECQKGDVAERDSSDDMMAERRNDGLQKSLSNEKLKVSADEITKHPLQHVWTLWYLENDRTKCWEDMQNEITSFDTVEDFWSLYNHISPPSELKLGSDYSLFKKNIRPMWEDAANINGGRWVITLNKMMSDDLDRLWLDVLLCLIGEVFDHLDQICGAVVNIRGKTNKISLWTSNGSHEEAILEIGLKLREALCLDSQNVLLYQLHRDAMVKQGATVKSTYTI